MTGLAVLTGLVAAILAYLQIAVPTGGPILAHADAMYYWQVAALAGLVALLAAAAVAWLSLGPWRRK
jgi:hypothetical protein